MTSIAETQAKTLEELADVRRQLTAARARLRQSAIEYAATPDGAATAIGVGKSGHGAEGGGDEGGCEDESEHLNLRWMGGRSLAPRG